MLRQVLRQVLRSGFESQTITDGRQVRIIYTLLNPLNNLGQFFSSAFGSHEGRSAVFGWTAGLSLKLHRRGSCGTYKIFYAEEETEEMVLEQWEDLKAEINVPTLRTLTFHQLWANMLVQYTDEYALVLRLVVISLLIPADTSECERIFSLMNDLKTTERNSMGQQNLKNLMLWHIMGYRRTRRGQKGQDAVL